VWWESAGLSLVLIALAEIGDKSQLVCMTLAARHGRALPVLYGAVAAFAILNGLAVAFGTTLAGWLPQTWVLAAMAVLFGAFGVQSLMSGTEAEDEEDGPRISGHGLFVTSFLMIFMAEFGDKTQISVAGLAGLYPPDSVWLGATVALVLTSAAGVWAGKTVLSRLPIVWLHRFAGGLFLALAVLAAWRLWERIEALP
jgi:putative Ca2+/H+ antiporter (TMEM165/GDT1 family)